MQRIYTMDRFFDVIFATCRPAVDSTGSCDYANASVGQWVATCNNWFLVQPHESPLND